MANFNYIFLYAAFCFGLILLLLSVSLFLVPRYFDEEKISIYECGFNPFGDSRLRFEVNFIVVAIIFIVFDLELVFLFPWIILVYNMSFWSFYGMLWFIIFLIIGLFYEVYGGALDWN